MATIHEQLSDQNASELPSPRNTEETWKVAEVERRFSVLVELESVVSANLQSDFRLRQPNFANNLHRKLAC